MTARSSRSRSTRSSNCSTVSLRSAAMLNHSLCASVPNAARKRRASPSAASASRSRDHRDTRVPRRFVSMRRFARGVEDALELVDRGQPILQCTVGSRSEYQSHRWESRPGRAPTPFTPRWTSFSSDGLDDTFESLPESAQFLDRALQFETPPCQRYITEPDYVHGSGQDQGLVESMGARASGPRLAEGRPKSSRARMPALPRRPMVPGRAPALPT